MTYTLRFATIVLGILTVPLASGWAHGFEDLQALALADSEESQVAPEDAASWHEKLWDHYLEQERQNEERRKEHKESALSWGDKTMRYEAFTIGEKSDEGYPLYIALHGGGGAPPRVNDSQWEHMKVYYRGRVESGVYVAPRGVTDTWNLHWVGESFPLYDRMIENMILFEGVDPNRVYILGFSAGGDGVYQLAPRMADRWAAANMSAGHPNGVPFTNLYNLPFLIQMGQNDSAYGRNRIAIEYGATLDRLSQEHPGGYVHRLFVHAGKGHNFRDNHSESKKQKILTQPALALQGEESDWEEENTNAIDWLSKYRRNPLPSTIRWDVATGASRATQFQDVGDRGDRFYWLGLENGSPRKGEVNARLDGENNRVDLSLKDRDQVLIFLNQSMIDFEKPLTVIVDGTSHELRVVPSKRWMAQTLLERGDPHYIFDACVRVARESDGWKARMIH